MRTLLESDMNDPYEDPHLGKNRLQAAITESDIKAIQEILETRSCLQEECSDVHNLLKTTHQYKTSLIIPKLLLSHYKITSIDNPEDVQIFLFAIDIDDLQFLRRWRSEHGLSINFQNSDGETPLHFACRRQLINFDRLRTVAYFLSEGADPNIPNREGLTPLHYVVKFARTTSRMRVLRSIFHMLVRSGVDVNARCNSGQTALHLSKIDGDSNFTFDLLRFGADLGVENNDGRTRLDDLYAILEEGNYLRDYEPFREPTHAEIRYYDAIRTLVYHVIRMQTLKLHVDEKTVDKIENLKEWLLYMDRSGERKISAKYINDGQSLDDLETFSKNCEIERKKLEDVKLDNVVSMYNIIFFNHHGMYRISRKKVFREYFEQHKCKQDFPIFWYFLEHQYNKGVVRSILITLARDSIKTLRLRLPETCLDHILEFFTDSELKQFIETIDLLFPVNKGKKIQLSALLYEKNNFNVSAAVIGMKRTAKSCIPNRFRIVDEVQNSNDDDDAVKKSKSNHDEKV